MVAPGTHHTIHMCTSCQEQLRWMLFPMAHGRLEEIHTGQEGRAEKVHCLQCSFHYRQLPWSDGRRRHASCIELNQAPASTRAKAQKLESRTDKCVPVSEGSWPASVRVPIVTLRMEILQWSMADERYEQC